MTICRWKKHWKITATLKIVITKEDAALKIFQCSFRVIFSVVFVWLDKNDLKKDFLITIERLIGL